jgi:hypothetical protein
LSASASDHGSEAEAIKMVKDAVALVKSAGPEKLTNRSPIIRTTALN